MGVARRTPPHGSRCLPIWPKSRLTDWQIRWHLRSLPNSGSMDGPFSILGHVFSTYLRRSRNAKPALGRDGSDNHRTENFFALSYNDIIAQARHDLAWLIHSTLKASRAIGRAASVAEGGKTSLGITSPRRSGRFRRMAPGRSAVPLHVEEGKKAGKKGSRGDDVLPRNTVLDAPTPRDSSRARCWTGIANREFDTLRPEAHALASLAIRRRHPPR
jgi:hypothetical protein